jgi:hypothetical protein
MYGYTTPHEKPIFDYLDQVILLVFQRSYSESWMGLNVAGPSPACPHTNFDE